MGLCQLPHRYNPIFANLPDDQGGFGRHKCVGCAYERGFQAGLLRAEVLNIDLNSLDESQAGDGRHKSPHAAYAMGYFEGVRVSYQ